MVFGKSVYCKNAILKVVLTIILLSYSHPVPKLTMIQL